MRSVFETYRDCIVQIATPLSTGTGFYYKNANIIITNFHVVEDNRQVIIEGAHFQKQLSQVLYTDARYDMAFLAAPEKTENLPSINIGDANLLQQGDLVGAVGHPFGLKYTTHEGIVSNTKHVMNDIRYLQHSAPINPGNSGGPLVNKNGDVVGINTYIIANANNIGFALPSEYLANAIAEYQKLECNDCTRCASCLNIASLKTVENDVFCPNCGAKITIPSKSEEYTPTGSAKTIEHMIEKIGYNVLLSRRGPASWEIQQGSAKIEVTYHEKTGLIMADAFLCQLPKENIKPIYEYLLRQNYEIENLTFSVHEQDVILSLLIYDRYLNESTGMTMFSRIFEKADYYDNILVEQFGALWKIEQKEG